MKLRNGILFALFVLLAGTSAFARESGVACASRSATIIAVAAPGAPPSLSAGLDEVGREYKEMWLEDQAGKRVKRACDFQCTQWCNILRDQCGTAPACQAAWEVCMCDHDCCSGPQGNPYCN